MSWHESAAFLREIGRGYSEDTNLVGVGVHDRPPGASPTSAGSGGSPPAGSVASRCQSRPQSHGRRRAIVTCPALRRSACSPGENGGETGQEEGEERAEREEREGERRGIGATRRCATRGECIITRQLLDARETAAEKARGASAGNRIGHVPGRPVLRSHSISPYPISRTVALFHLLYHAIVYASL